MCMLLDLVRGKSSVESVSQKGNKEEERWWWYWYIEVDGIDADLSLSCSSTYRLVVLVPVAVTWWLQINNHTPTPPHPTPPHPQVIDSIHKSYHQGESLYIAWDCDSSFICFCSSIHVIKRIHIKGTHSSTKKMCCDETWKWRGDLFHLFDERNLEKRTKRLYSLLAVVHAL